MTLQAHSRGSSNALTIHLFSHLLALCSSVLASFRQVPLLRGDKNASHPPCVVDACMSMHAPSLPSRPILCEPMDYSPTVSSVHEILQARILYWVAISSSRGSSQPRD